MSLRQIIEKNVMYRQLKSQFQREIMTREQKINFLKEGEKALGKDFQFARYSEVYGDFSNISDETLDELVDELDWLWK